MFGTLGQKGNKNLRFRMDAELETETSSIDVLTGEARGKKSPLDSLVLEDTFLSFREQLDLLYLENHYRALYEHMSREGSQQETQRSAELFPGCSCCTV